jgi:multimeric flavodoxin WrbA
MARIELKEGNRQKALILDGSRSGEEDLQPLRGVLCDALRKVGWEVEVIEARSLKIARCTGCFGCWVKTPGLCVIPDDAQDIARRVIQCDLLIDLTPVRFGGYSAELKRVLDRGIGLVLPYFTTIGGETHHPKRYPRYPKQLTIGLMAQPDKESERLFRALCQRNAINLYSPAHMEAVLASGLPAVAMQQAVSALLGKVGVPA